MTKIVLTGGPCAGKTTIMSTLTQFLTDRGYHVFICPETATELIENGICPNEQIPMFEFQKFVMNKQISKENLYNDLSKYYDNDKIIILFDRGIADGNAYCVGNEFKILLDSFNLTKSKMFARYDAVLHLVTTANGAEAFYQYNGSVDCNNSARRETPEEARQKDDAVLNSWVGHPHLRVFDNSTNFDGKIKRVINEICSILGVPVPKEIERKFLIKYPDENVFNQLSCISKSDIVQTYLTSNDKNVERRVRQRGTHKDGYTFYYTKKINVGRGERIEEEEKISPERYIELLTETDISMHQISKIRYCFVYKNRYFEMDVYPFNNEYAILEIELNEINEEIEMPPVTVIKEVTDDSAFKNSSLAKTLSFKI